jgi:uncharacterized membrane protein
MGDRRERIQLVARWALAGFMLTAGAGHFLASHAFERIVPTWLPFRLAIVWGSGVVEIAFALLLVLFPGHRRAVGRALAVFFLAVFPANIYQAMAGISTVGLRTPAERWARVAAEPLLIAWALLSTKG